MDRLNKVIDYIEDNLDGEISLDHLARLAGVNKDTLQRIFTFLTRFSIYDYIRRRRLSKAYEDLRDTDLKVLDIAIKYGYSSSAAFSHAFKKEFKLSPLQARKIRRKIKIFPKLLFQGQVHPRNELEAEIIQFPAKTLYGFKVTCRDYGGELYKIRRLYDELRAKGYYEKWEAHDRYGIFYSDLEHCYFVGTEIKEQGLDVFRLNGGKYAAFHLDSRQQKQILKLENWIYKQWLPVTNFKAGNNINFELYRPGGVDLYFSIH